MTAEKLDLKKAYPEYYSATTKPKVVHLEPYHYLTYEGVGSPDAPAFEEAIGQLYSLAYKVKFQSKANELDFVVPKLEGFWWVEGEVPFEEAPKKDWHWKLLMRMPDFIGKDEVNASTTQLIKEGKLTSDHELIFEEIHEGHCIQILHHGSYEEEMPTIEKLLQFANREGLEVVGKHHEIYLSDPMKTEVSKLKTIIRYAVK